MTAPTVDETLLWTLVAVLGVGTFALRLSFIQLRGWIDAFPPLVERSLGYVPPAVLAALLFPAVFALNGRVDGILNGRALAALVAVVVSLRTGTCSRPSSRGWSSSGRRRPSSGDPRRPHHVRPDSERCSRLDRSLDRANATTRYERITRCASSSPVMALVTKAAPSAGDGDPLGGGDADG